MTIVTDLEKVVSAIKHGIQKVFGLVEHEFPVVLSHLAQVYGPEVIAHAITQYKAAVEMYAAKGVDVAAADTVGFVQSSILDRFGLPPTAAQYISAGIHHLFTIGSDKLTALIDAGAVAAAAALQPPTTGTAAAPATTGPIVNGLKT